MKIKTSELLEILEHLKFVFINNNYIGASNYIYFNTYKGIIWTYSDTITYIHKYAGELKEDFELSSEEIAIPAKELYTLIKKIKMEEIVVKQVDNTFVIKNGRSTNTFAISTLKADSRKLEIEPEFTSVLPKNTNEAFKKHCLYDKYDKKCENIIFEESSMISSDRYNITKIGFIEEDITEEFAIRWDILKHILDKSFNVYGVANALFFQKEDYELHCNNTINNAFEYQNVMNIAVENLDYQYSIYMDKAENIDFIDTFLLNYKKLDKKIILDVISGKRLLVEALGENKTQKTKASINISKYSAAEPEKLEINVDYFKLVYENYDYINILDGMIYCCNVEENVERIVVVKNLED